MQIGMRGAAFVFVLGTVGHLQLQLERGQRRAQRVCRVGDKRALLELQARMRAGLTFDNAAEE